MKTFFGGIRADFRRAFITPVFIIAVLGTTIALFLGCASELEYLDGLQVDVLTLFGLTQAFGFSQMLPVFCALPFATCFCSDWNSQYIKACCFRSSKGKYAASKVVSCALAGGVAVALGEGLYLWILSFFMKVYDPVIERNFTIAVFNDLVAGGSNVMQYFIYRILIQAAFFAVFAVFALWISTYMPNVFVVLATPVVLYFILYTVDTTILSITADNSLYRYISFNTLFNANLNMGNDIKSFLYPIGVCLVLVILFGILTVQNIGRRIQHA